MSLSCTCGDYDYDDAQYFDPYEDYAPLNASRAKRCISCKALIKVGDLCLRFEHYRIANSDIEVEIYGEGEPVYFADKYQCEACADQYFNLTARGFCVDPCENMFDLLREYRQRAQEAKA